LGRLAIPVKKVVYLTDTKIARGESPATSVKHAVKADVKADVIIVMMPSIARYAMLLCAADHNVSNICIDLMSDFWQICPHRWAKGALAR
jgi:hypothetical protein